MGLVGVLLLVAIVWLLVRFGAMASPLARTLIQVRGGTIRVERGELAPRAKDHLADVVREARVERGHIAISHGGKVSFSADIPATLHQRVRNILLN